MQQYVLIDNRTERSQKAIEFTQAKDNSFLKSNLYKKHKI